MLTYPNFDPETMDLVIDAKSDSDGQQRALTFKSGSNILGWVTSKKIQRDRSIWMYAAELGIFLVLFIVMFAKDEVAGAMFTAFLTCWAIFMIWATLKNNKSLTGNMFMTRQRFVVNIPDDMYAHPLLKNAQVN